MNENYKLIIAGGGLSGSLLALALARIRPDFPFLLIEQERRFGGNHIWSFFDTDIAAADRWLIKPLLVQHWSGYDVAFPRRRRTLQTGYNSLSSERLDEVMRKTLDAQRYLDGATIAAVSPDSVRLSDGRMIRARTVIDARGPGLVEGMPLGWQKFLGQRLRLSAPHGLSRPIIMDSTVEQDDGYRFVYCLPFDATSILIEDTYYSLSPELDRELIRSRIADYAAQQGWQVDEIASEEDGILPIPIDGDVDVLWKDLDVPRIGLAGGFFHPATGYSLPDAVKVALLLAHQPSLERSAVANLLRSHAEQLWKRRSYYRMLNKLQFRAPSPGRQYRILEHFYRLDENLIARFYSDRLGRFDKARILMGRPPVPIGRAVAALFS